MPTRTAHDVTHFRHCGRLKSMATDQGDMFLTAGVSGLTVSGGLTVEPLTSNGIDDEGFNQAWWLYSDWGATTAGVASLGAERWGGDTYLGSTIYPGCVNIRYDLPASSGDGISVSTNNFNWYDRSPALSEAFNIVASPDGGFIIYLKDSDLCLTAGSSASDTLGSQNITPKLITYASKANQRWTLEEINEIAGIYQIAPCLGPEFAVSSPGQSTMSNSRLGIGSYDERDVSATWRIRFTSRRATLADPWKFYALPVVSVSGSTEVSSWGTPSDATPPCAIYQQRDVKYADSLSLHYEQKLSLLDVALKTSTGNYGVRQYALDPTADALSSQKDDQSLDSLVWGQTLSSVQSPENYPQFWYRLPRNTWGASLPQPYDIKIWMWDYDTNEGRFISSLEHIPSGHHIKLEPRFLCGAQAYQVTMRLSRDDGSEESSVVLSPGNSAVWSDLSQAPFAIPDVGLAWAPNSFVDHRGPDHYVHLDAGFDFPSGLWYRGIWGTVNDINSPVHLTLTIRSMSYDSGDPYYSSGSQNAEPWIPCQGVSSTISTRIDKAISLYISDATIDDENLILTWDSGSYRARRQDTDVVQFDHLDVRWTDSEGMHEADLLLTPYACDVATPQNFLDTKLRIPLTALDADVLLSIVAALAAGDSVTMKNGGDWTLLTQYGPVPLRIVSFSPGIPVSMEAGASAYMSSYFDSRYWTTYQEPSASQPITHAYARALTERGPVIVEMPALATDPASRIAIWADGGYLSANENPRHALLFARLSSSPNTLYYATSVDDLFVITTPTSSLGWRTSDGQLHLIFLDGNLSFSYSRQRDISSAIRRGGTHYLAASAGTEVPSLKFSGTLYRGQRRVSSTSDVIIHDSIDDLYRLPDDQRVAFRTSYGTTYQVIITSIDSPRSISGLANISISMLEVE